MESSLATIHRGKRGENAPDDKETTETEKPREQPKNSLKRFGLFRHIRFMGFKLIP